MMWTMRLRGSFCTPRAKKKKKSVSLLYVWWVWWFWAPERINLLVFSKWFIEGDFKGEKKAQNCMQNFLSSALLSSLLRLHYINKMEKLLPCGVIIWWQAYTLSRWNFVESVIHRTKKTKEFVCSWWILCLSVCLTVCLSVCARACFLRRLWKLWKHHVSEPETTPTKRRRRTTTTTTVGKQAIICSRTVFFFSVVVCIRPRRGFNQPERYS